MPTVARHLLDLARVIVGTAALGLLAPEHDCDEPAPAVPAWPDATQVSLIVFAATLFAVLVGGIWALALGW